MTINRKNIFACGLLISLSFSSCELKVPEEDTQTAYVVKSDESSDINKLGKLINLKNFRPEKIMYHHMYIETINGTGSEAEPKDDYLQAVLYFDSTTFQKMLEVSKNADYSLPNYSRGQFEFPWLERALFSELENSDSDYHGHPDLFFDTQDGKIWFLDQKILFYREIK